MRIAVLASGSGTLLDAILADGIPVALVVTDRPSKAEVVAEAHGVPPCWSSGGATAPTSTATPTPQGVVSVLEEHGIELVVMAGRSLRRSKSVTSSSTWRSHTFVLGWRNFSNLL